MSSWANRHIYSRRDISKIPEGLRPVIIGRADRPEVILSETFQKDTSSPFNEFNEYNDLNDLNGLTRFSSKTSNEILYPKERYPIKKVETYVAPSAIELTHNDQSYVFVVLRNLKTTNDNNLWISCYNSIRKFYKNKIIIIDDNSQINTINGKLVNTEVIYSEWNGAGESLPYYYFLQNKWADCMIFLHDSMCMYRRFTDDELENDIAFHWHFSHKDNANDNNTRKIKMHLALLPSKELQEYATDNNAWQGCFGAASIISYDVVKELEDKYKIFSTLVMNLRSRKDRQSFERIFGIVMYYEKKVDNSNCSNFGDIMKYPNAFEAHNDTVEKADNNIKQTNYNTAIMKMWRGR